MTGTQTLYQDSQCQNQLTLRPGWSLQTAGLGRPRQQSHLKGVPKRLHRVTAAEPGSHCTGCSVSFFLFRCILFWLLLFLLKKGWAARSTSFFPGYLPRRFSNVYSDDHAQHTPYPCNRVRCNLHQCNVYAIPAMASQTATGSWITAALWSCSRGTLPWQLTRTTPTISARSCCTL